MDDISSTTATCDCGQFELALKGSPQVQLVCHCRQCQAASGRPFVRLAFFRAEDVDARGPAIATSCTSASGFEKTYYTCSICGTFLYGTVSVLNGAKAVMAERLPAFKFEPLAHIWTDERVDRDSPTDAVPQLPEGPEGDLRAQMVASLIR